MRDRDDERSARGSASQENQLDPYSCIASSVGTGSLPALPHEGPELVDHVDHARIRRSGTSSLKVSRARWTFAPAQGARCRSAPSRSARVTAHVVVDAAPRETPRVIAEHLGLVRE